MHPVAAGGAVAAAWRVLAQTRPDQRTDSVADWGVAVLVVALIALTVVAHRRYRRHR